MKILDVPPSVLQILSLAQDADTHAWGQPQPIERPLSPVPALAPSMLPPEIWPWIKDIAHRMQCPIDYVAVGALVTLGAVVGTDCAIRPKQKDSWMEIPNIWGAVVGSPGSKKSPALGSSLAPLHRLERMAEQQYSVERLQYEMNLEQYKASLDHYKKQIRAGQAASHPGPAPTEPHCRRYVTSDATFEALGEILSRNPRGCLVYLDELTSLLAGFERAGREGERQGYLTAWNGMSGYRVDRITRGAIYIPRLALSVLGGIQPDKLEDFLAQTRNASGNDGFVQRLQLLVYPDPIEITRIVDDAPIFQAHQVVDDIVEILDDRIHTLNPEQDARTQQFFFRFDSHAQPHFYQWLLDLEQRVAAEDIPLMAEHLSKFRKLVPALALIDHLVGLAAGRIPYGKAVQRDSLDRALAYSEYLEAHARRVYALNTNLGARAAALLGKKITSKALSDGFSTRDIARKGWAGLSDPSAIKDACVELEHANWIRSNPPAKRAAGRPPLPTYVINPALLGAQFSEGKLTKATKSRKRRTR